MVFALEPYKDPRRVFGVRATYFLRYLCFTKIVHQPLFSVSTQKFHQVFDTAFLVADLIVWNSASNTTDKVLGAVLQSCDFIHNTQTGPVLWGLSILVALFGVYVSFIPTQVRALLLLLSGIVIFLLSVSLGVWRVAEYTRNKTIDTYLGDPSIIWLVAWIVSAVVIFQSMCI